MKLLVIGGSYFLGRVFVMLASKEHEVTVVNRGSHSLAEFPVKEIHGDRHDPQLWARCTEDYDAVVDFCAYQAGDIRTVVENLAGSVKQYIYISTVDVYAHRAGAAVSQESGNGVEQAVECAERDTWSVKCVGRDTWSGECAEQAGSLLLNEEAPFETVRYAGEEGAYITGKVALEGELTAVCGRAGIQTTALRPALLYGPFNYAPRESLYIRIMVQNRILPIITGAKGRFQFLYVKDGAEAILKCLLNEAAYGQGYNLCGDEIVDYGLLAQALKRADETEWKELTGGLSPQGSGEEALQDNGEGGLQELEIAVEQAQAQGFPLPFAVQELETHLCDNAKSKRELGMEYTPLEVGIAKTYRAFYGVFREG
ncbi:MAG: NAD-dependent epimerase/dehydratase family protein [Muribaculum sp.]|nr:NAD-dependent epimerase/dehydratase family protein [Muribaculum sp.]